jgi:hypothetical protein
MLLLYLKLPTNIFPFSSGKGIFLARVIEGKNYENTHKIYTLPTAT